MHAAYFSEWAPALFAGLGLSALAAIPFLLWVDADYLFRADWQPVRDRLLVETVNARHTAREARYRTAVTAAALLLLLSTPTTEVTS